MKPHHIESDPSRMLIRVEQGKGKKDRYTVLSKNLLKVLRLYWEKYLPEKWLNDRKAERLPCGYFHLVFTLPHELNPIILCNKAVTLAILFAAVNETLQAFARDPQ